jgi:hypothetical protein
MIGIGTISVISSNCLGPTPWSGICWPNITVWSIWRSVISIWFCWNGDEGIRTFGLRLAKPEGDMIPSPRSKKYHHLVILFPEMWCLLHRISCWFNLIWTTGFEPAFVFYQQLSGQSVEHKWNTSSEDGYRTDPNTPLSFSHCAENRSRTSIDMARFSMDSKTDWTPATGGVLWVLGIRSTIVYLRYYCLLIALGIYVALRIDIQFLSVKYSIYIRGDAVVI